MEMVATENIQDTLDQNIILFQVKSSMLVWEGDMKLGETGAADRHRVVSFPNHGVNVLVLAAVM
jgi:hypothetical protein